MSKENVKKFFGELERNADLRQRFDAVMSEYVKLASGRMAEFANSVGFNCSPDDFEEAMTECGELSDEEMQKVAGGRRRGYPPGKSPYDFDRRFY